MSEIDKVVQASAAGAEESASASEQLSSQALQMKEFAGELMDLVGGKCGRNRQAKKPAHSNRAVGELSPASFRCRSQQGLSSVLRDPGPPPETRGGDVAPDFS
jgi:methyl-accepting chemotaxis protein